MIVSYFNYCNLIWASCANMHLNKLYRLQKKAVRLVFSASQFSHAVTFFHKLSRLKIYHLYHFQLASFVYKIIKEPSNESFNQYFFNINSSIHGHYTRSCLDLHAGYARTWLRASSVAISGPIGIGIHCLLMLEIVIQLLYFKDTLEFLLFLIIYE